MNCSESLTDWKTRNEALRARLTNATCDLDDAALNRRPDPQTWSPAQVVEHLVLTNRPYLQTIETALKQSEKRAGNPAVRYSFFGKLIAKAAGPGGNAPAPKALHPRTTPISREILEEWRQQQARLLSLLDFAAGIDLSGVSIHNPFVRLIRMNIADCFELLTAHTERHVEQIEARVPQSSAVP